jgi:hypothetical protein
VVVKGFHNHTYRVIDLNADVASGEYPLFDLYIQHGRVLFRLYATSCRGCNFNQCPSGIRGVGCEMFIRLTRDE